MKGRWEASLLALALIPVACARTHDALSIAIREAPDAASGPAGHVAVRAGGAHGNTHSVADAGRSSSTPVHDGGASDTAAGAPVAADTAANDGAEVWIGQLWSVAHALCDPDAAWSDTPLVVEPMGYIDRVVLILKQGRNAQLQGSIQLGEGALPTSPGDAPYADSDGGSYWLCSIQIPTRGVEYELLEPIRTSDRLMFQVSASAVWNTWCQTQGSPCPGAPDGACPPRNLATIGPVCACDAGACTAAEHHRVAFDLAVTADTIEGQLPSLDGAFGTPAELRLRRVQ
jgi:hypothetical protein